jgi:hypothetical protein
MMADDRRVWIVFFSDGGNTRRIAEDLVEHLDGELVMLRAPDLGSGLIGAYRRVRDSLLKRPTRIESTGVHVGPDDLVVVGSPVWTARLASPVRAWLQQHAAGIRRYAAFVTLGSNGAERALDEVSALLGRPPEATLAVTDHDRSSGGARRRVDEFAARLRRTLRPTAEPSDPADDVVAFPRRS